MVDVVKRVLVVVGLVLLGGLLLLGYQRVILIGELVRAVNALDQDMAGVYALTKQARPSRGGGGQAPAPPPAATPPQ